VTVLLGDVLTSLTIVIGRLTFLCVCSFADLLIFTILFGNFRAFLVINRVAVLFRDLLTFLVVHGFTVLLGDLVALLVIHRLAALVGDLLALLLV